MLSECYTCVNTPKKIWCAQFADAPSENVPCSTTFLLLDAQSVKNTDMAKEKGYDAGKKVSGIKGHLAVDTLGLPAPCCHRHYLRQRRRLRRGSFGVRALCRQPQYNRPCCATAAIRENIFPLGFKEILHEGVEVQSPNATNSTPLKCCQNAGSSNAVSLGWRKIVGSGRIVNASPTPAYNLSSSLSFSKDYEQVLRLMTSFRALSGNTGMLFSASLSSSFPRTCGNGQTWRWMKRANSVNPTLSRART